VGLAETAKMAVQLDLTGNYQTNLKAAAAETEGFATKASGSVGKAAGAVESAAGKVSGALSHAKQQVGNLLTGPLGILGLGAGLFTLAGAFEASVGKAQDFGYNVLKISALTGMSVEKTSLLVAVLEKYGISEDKATTLAAFAEKTLGKLNATTGNSAKATEAVTKAQEKLHVAQLKLNELQAKGTATASQLAAAHNAVTNAEMALHDAQTKLAGGATKLAAIDKEYGLRLVDNKGKVVDYDEELKQLADLWQNKNIPAEQKAALSAQLLGRSYATLVPLLQLGRKGMNEAEQAAADLGYKLDASNAKSLKDYRENMMGLSDAVSGLELQIGLHLIPTVGDLAKGVTKFIADPKNRETLMGFLDGALQTARGFAAFVTGTLIPAAQGIAGAVKGAWDAIPPELRDLLLKALVANKVIKFTFGIDIAGTALDTIKSGIADAFGVGARAVGASKLVSQHVWVDNMIEGGLGGGGAGAAEEAGAAGAAAEVGGGITASTIGALALVAAIPLIPLVATYFLAGGATGIAQADYKGRQTTAAARGLDPSKVPFTPPNQEAAAAAQIAAAHATHLEFSGRSEREVEQIQANTAASAKKADALAAIKDASQGTAKQIAAVHAAGIAQVTKLSEIKDASQGSLAQLHQVAAHEAAVRAAALAQVTKLANIKDAAQGTASEVAKMAAAARAQAIQHLQKLQDIKDADQSVRTAIQKKKMSVSVTAKAIATVSTRAISSTKAQELAFVQSTQDQREGT
jgi:hypothetical protein